MSDDWRLQVQLADDASAGSLAQQLHTGGHEHELSTGFADKVIISVDGSEVFAYAGSRAQAEAAGRLIDQLASASGWTASSELKRWHSVAEEWEDPDKPLPNTPAGQAAERGELMDEERAESTQMGSAEWEVRIDCGSHRDATALDQRLRDEGLQSIRRWRFLVLGVADEDDARALAQRIETEAPEGTKVTVEATPAAMFAETGLSLFSFFGGYGL
jgi:hypothetical protein